jgi:integrase
MKSDRLTKTKIVELELPENTERNRKRGVWHPDGDVDGLRVVVYPSGRRRWKLYYRTRDGRQRFHDLGDATAVHPDKARAEARSLIGDVARGSDPAAERDDRRAAPTMGELVERYREEHLPRKKERSQREDNRLIERHILPKLAKHKVEALSFRDVEALHRSLKATPYQANRVVALLSKMLELAERWGWRAQNTNVARRVEKYREVERSSMLSEIEVTRVAAALAELEAEGYNPVPIAALRFIMLTGLRLNEVLPLRWDDIDLERGFLTLHDPKNRTPRRVPLSGPSVELLELATPKEGNPFVFPGRRPGAHLVDLKRIWERVIERTGIKTTSHDLRRTFASISLSGGLPLAAVGKLLGHKSTQTTARYAKYMDETARQEADIASAPLARALAAGRRNAARRAEGGDR